MEPLFSKLPLDPPLLCLYKACIILHDLLTIPSCNLPIPDLHKRHINHTILKSFPVC